MSVDIRGLQSRRHHAQGVIINARNRHPLLTFRIIRITDMQRIFKMSDDFADDIGVGQTGFAIEKCLQNFVSAILIRRCRDDLHRCHQFCISRRHDAIARQQL